MRGLEILNQAAEIIKNLTALDTAGKNEYLQSHLTEIGKTYARLRDIDSSTEFFDMAHARNKKSTERSDYDRRDLVRTEITMGHIDKALELVRAVGDPMNKFNAYVDVANSLIDKGHLAEAFQILTQAESISATIDPRKYVGGVLGDPQLTLATQYYRLAMLTR